MAVSVQPVDVVMVSFFTGPALFESLDRLLTDPDVDRIVLVDNGNHADSRARLADLAAAHPRLIVVSGQGNVGFGRACNLGMVQTRAEAVLILNPDSLIAPGAAGRMRDRLATLPAPAMVGAALYYPDGREQRGARRGDLTPLTAFAAVARLRHIWPAMPDHWRIHFDGDPMPDAPVTMPTVSGAAFMMRRVDYLVLGGFDEGYFLHVEDIDLCRRVRAAGGVVMFDPCARVVHYGSTSRVSSLFIEWHKGCGFVRYFIKFARTPWGKACAVAMAPVILGLSLSRPVLRPWVRRLFGRMA